MSDKTISLFGYGKIMQSLCKILAPCRIYDDTFKKISNDEFGNTLLPSSAFQAQDSTLEIISPGIPPYSYLAKIAQNLISEYDYFYRTYGDNMPFSIWISGTNGKTTTTQMTQHLLESEGSCIGGNIGIPLCKMSRNAAIWILETSSFVLHYTNYASPNIYALLPITPDHLSWHGDMSHYVDSKLKPLLSMNPQSYAIIPSKYADFTQVKNFKGKLYLYSDVQHLARIIDIDVSRLRFKGAFLLDCVMALALQKIICNRLDYATINTFHIGQHRVEEFFDENGRLFVDDSKATNIDATLEALKIYRDKMIYLILGGDNKNVSLEPLIAELPAYHIKVFAIGKSAEHIISLCKQYNVPNLLCKELKIAMNAIDSVLKIGEVCLLSPACASLDQFVSYKQRGELFKLYAIG